MQIQIQTTPKSSLEVDFHFQNPKSSKEKSKRQLLKEHV